MDAWWVGNPRGPTLSGRVAALHLGAVTTRSRRDRPPHRQPAPGRPARRRSGCWSRPRRCSCSPESVLHVTCDLQVRALEVARLRGLGMSRREIRTVLLGQHAAVLLPPCSPGRVVGAVATVPRGAAADPVRYRRGPVPDAVPHWPWGREALLLAVLLAGCALAVTRGDGVQARRADAAHLRVTS